MHARFAAAAAFLAASMSVSSCAFLDPQPTPNAQTATFVSTVTSAEAPETPPPAPLPEKYTLFYDENNYRLSLYEPKDGCYAGAAILSDKAVNRDIPTFEAMTAPQAVYMNEMSIADPFPKDWVLNCISGLKTPLVVLDVPAGPGPDDAALINTAKAFNEFYFPMFIAFDPVTDDRGAADYIQLYQRARNIFRMYASNCAFVWCVSQDKIPVCSDYYPGDDYTDWVCAGVSEKLTGGGAFDNDLLNTLNYFYYTYQKQKPVMLIASVSHYTDLTHAYQTDAAVKELRRIYAGLRDDYPRVKAVIYNDANASDDFSVTDDENLTRTYKSIVSNPYFQNIIDIMSNGDTAAERMRSAFPAYKLSGGFYIAQSSLSEEIGIKGAADYVRTTNINGDAYFDMNDLQYCGIGSFDVDGAKNTLIFRR